MIWWTLSIYIILPFLIGWTIVLMILMFLKKGFWWCRISVYWFGLLLLGVVIGIVYCVHYIAFGLAWFFLFGSNISEYVFLDNKVDPRRIVRERTK